MSGGKALARRKLGETWEQPIRTILRTWVAGDSGTGRKGDWAYTLNYKREDNKAEGDHLVDSIRRNGFDPKRPVQVARRIGHDGKPIYTVENGHHRLTAAIDLGYTKVPVKLLWDGNRYAGGLGWDD